jgi:hypothetical protein
MARSRRARNQWGKANNNRRFLFQGYTFAPTSAVPLAKAISGWAFLEIKEGWRSWFGTRAGGEKLVAARRQAGSDQLPRQIENET